MYGPRRDRARIEVPTAPSPGPRPASYLQRSTRAMDALRSAVPQTGRAILTFGPWPGSTHARLVVTDQRDLPADAIVRAELALEATVDHSADEHLVEQIKVRAGAVIPGVGFTVHAVYAGGEGRVYGQWTIVWSWS